MTDEIKVQMDFEKIEAEALLRAEYSETGFLWQCITTVFAALAVYVFSIKEFLGSAPCYNNYPLLLIGNFLAIMLLWILNRISIISGYSFRQWQIVLARIRTKHRLFDRYTNGVIPSRWSLCMNNKTIDFPEYQKFFAYFSIIAGILVFAITIILYHNCWLWLIIELVIAALMYFFNYCYWRDRFIGLETLCEYNTEQHNEIINRNNSKKQGKTCRFCRLISELNPYKWKMNIKSDTKDVGE